jgi:hypothetical protein
MGSQPISSRAEIRRRRRVAIWVQSAVGKRSSPSRISARTAAYSQR